MVDMNENKIAVVPGSNRGIGFATVKELLNKGYQVILTARKEQDGMAALNQLGRPAHLDFHTLDVSDMNSINTIKEYVIEKYGQLDILINNAGINYDTWQSASNANLEEVQQTLETNVFGAWNMIKAFYPLMEKNKYGRIVNVSSGAGSLNEMGSGTPGYSISKAALNVLTIKFAQELSNKNILINSVCPGWVRTDMGGSSAPRSPKEGSETIIWAAELPNNSASGKFFRDMKEIDW
jgi:NAD(P)-dependent dehydrogenase (short-subunit alcohol dehydrogenase family)